MSQVTREGSGQTEAGTNEQSEFAALLQKKFKPVNERAREEIESAVTTLAQQALVTSTVISSDALVAIQSMIAEIDRRLSEQINVILHQPDFQNLEGSWRGLHYLVNNTETDQMLKIRVMNISKKELKSTLRKFKGAKWDQSPLFKKIYGAEYDQLGGAPYACIVADYYFNHEPEDVEALGELSKIAAAAHSPVITAAHHTLFGMESWQKLGDPTALDGIFATPSYAAWRSLRESEDSRYLGMTLPRFLSRRPYGAKSTPVDEFAFEEDTSGEDGSDASKFTWANSAYAMAVNVTRSFKEYGWCSRIRGLESGGAVNGLPTHTFNTDDGGVDATCPTEIAIGHRRDAELAKLGFMALVHQKDTDVATFFSAQSLQKPVVYADPDATANAVLAARLPYLFATCRFAHYLKSIGHAKVGSFTSAESTQRWLMDWITDYIDGDPDNSPEEVKARKPLAAAEVVVTPDENNPGYYNAKFSLRPHYQLEGLTISLSLVSKLPSQRQG